MLENEDILFIGLNHWDDIVQRPQHIARGLAENNRVLYVDPTHYSILTWIRQCFQKERQGKTRHSGFRNITDSLYVFTPPPLMPFSLQYGTLNEINCRTACRLLKPHLAEMAFEPSLLWLNFPSGLPYLSLFNPTLTCFDCLDNYPEFFPGRRGRLLEKQEKALLGQVDLVIATATGLAEKCKAYSSHAYCLPNAVSTSFLDKGPAPCPSDLAALPRPIIGYIGLISHWFDFELIAFLAKERPHWSLVVIGPQETKIPYNNMANLHFLNAMAHDEIPAFIDHFDACLIPFKINALTEHVNPVKLYEYLARGKPVIATATAEMAQFSPVCFLADNKENFLKNIDIALQEKGEEQKQNIALRRHMARENIWPHRVAAISELLEKHLRKKRTPHDQG